ncbi:MAG: hypothetical protein F6K10_22710 [Moorea sp. SIO2B7]|nr:hypothetical protein [Moorena sp. SIO2B7]
MNILSKLKNRKLGLIELMSMGFEVYIKNLKPILLIFSTIYLPFLIIMSGRQFLLSNNPLELSIFVFSLYRWQNIYFIPIAILPNNYVYGRHYNYQSVFKKILASLVPLLLMSLEFIIVVFLLSLRACITVSLFLLLLFFGFLFLLLFSTPFHISFFTVSIVLVYMVIVLRLIVLNKPVIPVIIYYINSQYYGLAFILIDQWGEDAFAYSRSIVKDNWWRVFLFSFLVMVLDFGLPEILIKLFNNIPFINYFWFSLLSQTLAQFIAIGIVIGSTLLFLNLDFQKKIEN